MQRSYHRLFHQGTFQAFEHILNWNPLSNLLSMYTRRIRQCLRNWSSSHIERFLRDIHQYRHNAGVGKCDLPHTSLEFLENDGRDIQADMLHSGIQGIGLYNELLDHMARLGRTTETKRNETDK